MKIYAWTARFDAKSGQQHSQHSRLESASDDSVTWLGFAGLTLAISRLIISWKKGSLDAVVLLLDRRGLGSRSLLRRRVVRDAARERRVLHDDKVVEVRVGEASQLHENAVDAAHSEREDGDPAARKPRSVPDFQPRKNLETAAYMLKNRHRPQGLYMKPKLPRSSLSM